MQNKRIDRETLSIDVIDNVHDINLNTV